MMIKNLSASVELDRAAMLAVLGGEGDQANGTSQSNGQTMTAAANVGNGSVFGASATIQSDNTFTQDAHNTSYSANFDFAALGLLFPFGLR